MVDWEPHEVGMRPLTCSVPYPGPGASWVRGKYLPSELRPGQRTPPLGSGPFPLTLGLVASWVSSAARYRQGGSRLSTGIIRKGTVMPIYDRAMTQGHEKLDPKNTH